MDEETVKLAFEVIGIWMRQEQITTDTADFNDGTQLEVNLYLSEKAKQEFHKQPQQAGDQK